MTRLLSGAVLLAFAIAVVWFAPARVFFAVALLLTLIASYELVGLARAGGLAVSRGLSPVAAASTLAAASLPGPPWALTLTLLAALLALALATLASWRGGAGALATVAASLLPSIYLGLPIAALVSIRADGGPASLFLLMFTIIVSDTAQYYSGRAFGRRPLAPTISPKKTVEGAVGGFGFGALALAAAGHWWLPGVPLVARAVAGLAVVALGIAGDLFESMLKRSAGVKDSSGLIPGHGGILDRIDALLFAAPVYYLVLKYM